MGEMERGEGYIGGIKGDKWKLRNVEKDTYERIASVCWTEI